MLRDVRWILIFLLVALSWTLAGCGKKPQPRVELPPQEEAPAPEEPTQPIRPETPGAPEGEEATDVVLEDIFFDFDRYHLRPDALAAMERNARVLMENPDVTVILEGHCDERGTTEYNLALGEKRAKAAYDFLVRYGIDPSRLTTISYGEERPFDPGHNEEAWAKNRRVHFVVRRR
jgi:peptidoglycan-associated lipoprotein